MKTAQQRTLNESQAILKWIKSEGYSYSEVARYLGKSRETISKIANGTADCTGKSILPQLREIAKQNGYTIPKQIAAPQQTTTTRYVESTLVPHNSMQLITNNPEHFTSNIPTTSPQQVGYTLPNGALAECVKCGDRQAMTSDQKCMSRTCRGNLKAVR